MSELLSRAQAAFSTLTVPEAVRAAALTRLERWLCDPATVAYVPMIEALAAAGRWELLLDSFYQVIPFGTGGRRGPVGVGPNRINPYTLSSSVQGHCAYLHARFEAPAVVIAYDVRRFLDARGLYPKEAPNPVMGLSSRDFAELAAGVYAANGVRVHMLPRGSAAWVSTPELSFSIRHLGAQGGLNVSASHNPPDDNGAKVYDERGGQQVPPYDEELVNRVEQVTEVRSLGYEAAVEAGWVLPLGPEVHQAYLRTNLTRSLWTGPRDVRVVFTALHGTGSTTVLPVLRAAGFGVELEPTQAEPDGRFPNVPFATPNPEVPQSMDRAVALAQATGAELVMACDPDADRLGVVVRHRGGWRFLSGNELGALVVDFALRRGRFTGPPVVFRTEVSSSLVSRVARARGALVVDDLLVGFKYIADGLRALEEQGRFRGIEARVEDFAAGMEESHGVLVTPALRDKDAAGGALLLAESAQEQKQQGRTLVDQLETLWGEVGYVSNRLVSTVMRGATGRARIEQIQASFRASPPRSIGGHPVTAFYDRQDPSGPLGPVLSGTDLGSRDVLVFELGQAGRVILRPSGTEPKNKVYAELVGTPGAGLEQEVPRVDAACQALAEAFVAEMLGRVGLSLPGWAIRVSDLVAVEQKQHFAEVLMPGLAARLEAVLNGEHPDVEGWLDAELRPYGKDPRGLVAPGVLAWIYATRAHIAIAEQLGGLFKLR